ncbi:hypothetical protein SPMU_24620 [Sphingomonas mucosissima]|uniref:Uncharacterized protein n=1 Tax=Sphingomonas mucosissima TaxID=370959 RepID=A0A245ZGQ5_9SPHN|nr:hypothetical protein SPMU_24620 [Sphingomonas mucosissima]
MVMRVKRVQSDVVCPVQKLAGLFPRRGEGGYPGMPQVRRVVDVGALFRSAKQNQWGADHEGFAVFRRARHPVRID